MTPARRWVAVATGVALLVATPVALKLRPVDDPDVSASTLMKRIGSSASVGFSGYAETKGNLQIPVTDNFTGIAKLLGDSTELRVWWRGDDSWRVDSLSPTGETDLVKQGQSITSWRWESAKIVRSIEPDFRLPQTSDLVPAMLGRRLLQAADPADVTRIPAVRVAGVTAPGVRLTPDDPLSTVGHVDVWADERTGLPLRVEAYAKGVGTPIVSSAFRSVDLRSPAESTVSFAPPPGVDVSFDEAIDIGSAANQFAEAVPPSTLLGITRNATPAGAVGQYGQGVTTLLVIPLWHSTAHELRDQLERTIGSRLTPYGVRIGVGPVNVLLTSHERDEGSWLLIGTVSVPAIRSAASELEPVPS